MCPALAEGLWKRGGGQPFCGTIPISLDHTGGSLQAQTQAWGKEADGGRQEGKVSKVPPGISQATLRRANPDWSFSTPAHFIFKNPSSRGAPMAAPYWGSTRSLPGYCRKGKEASEAQHLSMNWSPCNVLFWRERGSHFRFIDWPEENTEGNLRVLHPPIHSWAVFHRRDWSSL